MSVNTVGVQLSNASLRYNDSEHATLSGLSLSLNAGKWTVLLGRSGCGKTTVLRYLAGLLDDKVEWQGTLVTSDELPLTDRIAYMAQQDLLLPWLSVIDNKAQQTNQALELLAAVGLADHASTMPDQLSGGMRQRVALARTLMQDKPVVLMDEPFSALDAVTRHKLQSLACELLRDKTVVLITHDPQEAVRLADNLYVLQGTPANAQSLSVPNTATPRVLDGECAELQQAILDQLERDYE
ncbi:UNVERIFIED_CONTAM: hypothetical protein GTU68_066031 [Idotea baltica]|nr:hypothetical protein [Idotea baltica]